MTFNGGTVLFSDEVLQDKSKINSLIFNILMHQDTNIEVIKIVNDTRKHTNGKDTNALTGIFKITSLNATFSSHFKSNPTQNIKAPSVLIIKLFINYPTHEVSNEIAIQKELGSQSNVMPICPSFLFAETIKTREGQPTRIGEAFYKLFQTKKPQNFQKFCNDFRSQDPIQSTKYVQDILIMEFIDCDNYFDFYEKTLPKDPYKRFPKDSFYKYITLTIEIKLSASERTSEELQNFYTYYMASLLAIKDFHHCDIHSDNIMICCEESEESKQEDKQINTKRTNIFPFVIDFGRAGKINSEELVFKELQTPEAKNKLGLNDTTKPPPREGPNADYLRPIYLNARANKDKIVDYVLALIAKENYVDAVLTLSMCVNPKVIPDESLFEGFYDYEHEPYGYLYKMNTDRKKKYNTILKQLIEKRKQLEQALKPQLAQKKKRNIKLRVIQQQLNQNVPLIWD